MFSLIITIVSVALVAALAVATIYYGSDAAEKGRISARAGAIVSAGEQVAAGLSIYRLNTGRWPDTLETMVTEKYLNGLPEIAAADSLSFIASAHAAPAVEGDWLYDPDTPHLAYVKPISLEVCAEVNRRISGRRMVLNVLDPGIKVQCAAAGGDPVVVFRNSEVPLTTPPAIPGAPSVGSGGEFGEVGRVIDTEGEDTSGRCVYACEPGGSGSGGSGEVDTAPPAPPPPQAPELLEPSAEYNYWVPEGGGYCSPELPDDGFASIEFSEVVAEKTMRAVLTGERYVSSEAEDDRLGIILDWESDDDYGWGGLFFSGDEEGWQPFTYATTVPAGASIYVYAGYGKGPSGAAGEDRACVRGVTLSFEATEDTETDPSPGGDVPAIAARCVYDGYYLGSSAGFDVAENQYEVPPSCSPFLFPKDWDLSDFERAEFAGSDFGPVELYYLQQGSGGVLGVWTAGGWHSYDSAQTASLTAYGEGGRVIGTLAVPIEAQAVSVTGVVRLDKPYVMYPAGVPEARYRLSFGGETGTPTLVSSAENGITVLGADTFAVSESDGLAGELAIVRADGFGNYFRITEGYRHANASLVRSPLAHVACTSSSKDLNSLRYAVSTAADNPYGANIVSRDRSAASDTLEVSFLDLPESGPHTFSAVAPFSITVKGSSVSSATAADLSHFVSNSGLIRYTYQLGVTASGPGIAGIRLRNRYGADLGLGLPLTSTDSVVTAVMAGTATCTDPDFDPDVVTLPDEG